MTKFQGTVIKLSKKEGTTQKGKPWYKFSVKLLLDGGQESPWISLAFSKPSPFAEGQYVAFDTAVDEKGYVNLVEGTGSFPTPPVKAAVAANAAVKGTASPAYQDKQDSIVMQHSQEMAISLTTLLLANDALPLLGTKGKAGEAKRFEEIINVVNKLTVQLFNDVKTLRLLESVEDAGDVPVEETADASADAPIANSDLDADTTPSVF